MKNKKDYLLTLRMDSKLRERFEASLKQYDESITISEAIRGFMKVVAEVEGDEMDDWIFTVVSRDRGRPI